ncbi:hypothetical protein LIER_42347 [Lithospermum erythrorhizon]|uniref:Uncharacterized protein n=1 Tax=Lithospermum erythrorhizon TaxID=34254 RepID=A0AAV3RN84_LITER
MPPQSYPGSTLVLFGLSCIRETSRGYPEDAIFRIEPEFIPPKVFRALPEVGLVMLRLPTIDEHVGCTADPHITGGLSPPDLPMAYPLVTMQNVLVFPEDLDEHRIVLYPQLCTDREYFGQIPLMKGDTPDLFMWSPLLGVFLLNLPLASSTRTPLPSGP